MIAQILTPKKVSFTNRRHQRIRKFHTANPDFIRNQPFKKITVMLHVNYII